MKKIFRLAMLAVFSLLILFPRPSSGEQEIRRVRDGRTLTFREMMTDMRGSRLIFVGEVHDSETHHRLQLDVIRALKGAGVPVAIGVEMFNSDYQRELDRWVAGKTDLMSFVRVYRENWTIPWSLYDAIFLYARNNGIPIIALNPPKEVVQKVFHKGFSSLSAQEREKLPEGVSCEVDTPYRRFVKGMFREHDMDDRSFENFCEAQMLRNRTMARLLLEYLEKNPRMTVVVLAGVGHAMKRGVPDELKKDAALPVRVVIPPLGEAAGDTLKSGDADYLVTAYD